MTQYERYVKYIKSNYFDNMKNYEKLMNRPIILDGRNCYSLDEAKENNLIYNSIGRKEVNNL